MKLLLPYVLEGGGRDDQQGASLASAQNTHMSPILEMLKALSQELCVVARYRITDNKSVVWVWHHNEAECTRAMEKHAACPLAPKSPSCCLEVRWKRDTQNPMVVMKRIIGHWQNKLGSGALVTSVRSTGMVALFKSIESAKEALIQAKELLAGDATMSSLTLRSINLNEHMPVPARLAIHGSQSTSSDNLSSSLKLTEFARSALAILDEPAVVLSAEYYSSTLPQGRSPGAEVVLLVPSSYDAHILRAKGTLALRMGTGSQDDVSLVMAPNSSFDTVAATKRDESLSISPPCSPALKYKSTSMGSCASNIDEDGDDESDESPLHSDGTNGGNSDSSVPLATDRRDKAHHQQVSSSRDSTELWHRPAPRAASRACSGSVELRDATAAELFRNLGEWNKVAAMHNTEVTKNAVQQWEIVVEGADPSAVRSQLKAIDKLVAAANANSSKQDLQQWEHQHVEAMTGNISFAKLLKDSNAAVLFSRSDKDKALRKGEALRLQASICALDAEGHSAVRDYLADLNPKKATWTCTVTVPSPADLRIYAVYSEQARGDLGLGGVGRPGHTTNLNVWGFGSQLNRAFDELVGGKKPTPTPTPISPAPSPLTISVSSPSNSCSNPVSTASSYSTSPRKGAASTSNKVTHSEGSGAKHKATFTFQDREAGVFFQSFEDEFRVHILQVHGVELVMSDSSAVSPSAASAASAAVATTGSPDSKSPKFDVRAPAVKITMSSHNAKEVALAKAYFEQMLNTMHLARCQVSFPKTSVDKYKELHQFKNQEDKRLRSVRDQEERQPTCSTDPLRRLGFINIRIKPPLHSKGIKRMALPCDVTVTLCGPFWSKGQLDSLKDLEKAFNSLPSDFFSAVCELPAASPITRQLTVRSSREQFIKEFGLAGVRFDEGSKNKGGHAAAKLWAPQNKQLAKVLDEIKQACPETRVLPPTAMPSQLPEFEETSIFFLGSQKTAALSLDLTSPLGGRDEFPPLQTKEGQQHAPGLSPSHAHAHLSLGLGLGLSPGGDTSTHRTRTVIHWPHLSLRFVFLTDPFKATLTAIIQSHRCRGVVVTLPYRDKADPTACILLEGENSLVAKCAHTVSDYMQQILSQQRSVQVVVSGPTLAKLTAGELCLLKEIQGRCGVHIVLEPSTEDLEGALWRFDTRLLNCTPMLISQPSTPSPSFSAVAASLPLARGSQSIGDPGTSHGLLQLSSPFNPFDSPVGPRGLQGLQGLGPLTPLGGSSSPFTVGYGSPWTDDSGCSSSFFSTSPGSPTKHSSSPSSLLHSSSSLSPGLFSPGFVVAPGRLPFSPLASKLSHATLYEGAVDAAPSPKTDTLLRLLVNNKHVKSQRIEVAVVSDTQGSCLGHGAECLLLIVDKAADAGLSAEKIAQLNRGQPIVDEADPSLGNDVSKKLIRVRPLPSASIGDAGAQQAALTDALLIALNRADSMPNTVCGVVIVVPDLFELLDQLSTAIIQEVIATKTLQFAQDKELKTLRRLVLLNHDDTLRVSGGLQECNLADPPIVQGDVYCSTLLSRVAEDNSSLLRFFDVRVVESMVPLPAALPLSCVGPPGERSGERSGDKATMTTCLLRGQAAGVLETVRELSAVSRSFNM